MAHAVYHEAFCRFEIGDIATLKGLDKEMFKIEEICLQQFVKANKLQFLFMLCNVATGELSEEWIPHQMMGEIIQYANGEKPKGK